MIIYERNLREYEYLKKFYQLESKELMHMISVIISDESIEISSINLWSLISVIYFTVVITIFMADKLSLIVINLILLYKV